MAKDATAGAMRGEAFNFPLKLSFFFFLLVLLKFTISLAFRSHWYLILPNLGI